MDKLPRNEGRFYKLWNNYIKTAKTGLGQPIMKVVGKD